MENNNILVIPDVHGRNFWEKAIDLVDNYKRVVFLGDYLDMYAFDEITPEEALLNFEKIIKFKTDNPQKVILLLGNHDMPYYSRDYYNMHYYHSRHMKEQREVIVPMFEENKDLFQIAYTEDDILFTHAGLDESWLRFVYKKDIKDMNEIVEKINVLTDTKEGLAYLYMVTSSRGGRDRCGSCIWNHVTDMEWLYGYGAKDTMKQIFGHTLQAYSDRDSTKVVYTVPVEFGNCKMLDCAKCFELNVEEYKIKEV